MDNRYDIKKWEESSMKNLFIWQFFLGRDQVSGWSLTESNKMPGHKGQQQKEYYLQNNEDKEKKVKVDVIECSSGQQAREMFRHILQNHMSTELPALSNRKTGDAAYMGTGSTPVHVLFVRANIITIINSIGEKDIPVADIAKTLDELFIERPHPSEKEPLFDITWEEGGPIQLTKDLKANRFYIDAKGASARPVWFKFFIDDGEVFADGDQLLYTAGDKKENKLSVFVIGEWGYAGERVVDLTTGGREKLR